MKKHDHVYSIDYYAYMSGIREWSPQFKVALSGAALLFCIFADNVCVSLLIALSMGYLTVRKGRVHFHDYADLMEIPLVFMLLSGAAIAVGYSRTAVGEFCVGGKGFYLYVTAGSLYHTLCILLKAFGAVSAMYMLALSTPVNEIVNVLRRMHLPKFFLELMNLIYRYIFILMDIQLRLKNSAESRLGYCDFKTSCRTFGASMSTLLLLSLKKAGSYYDAMEARCYDGEMLFLEKEKAVTGKQLVFAAVYFAVLVLVKGLTERNTGIF